MGRIAVQEAIYQFFGGAPNTYETAKPSIFGGTQGWIFLGEPFDSLDQYLPVMFVVVPDSYEFRFAARTKMVDYEAAVYLAAMIPGNSQQGDGGPRAIATFYQWLDDIAAKIRTDKTLSAYYTPDEPNELLVRFGEQFTIRSRYKRLEQTALLFARILISATEQVSGI